ncbi:hypothetical protein D3C87_1924610 [compost metagenome]
MIILYKSAACWIPGAFVIQLEWLPLYPCSRYTTGNSLPELYPAGLSTTTLRFFFMTALLTSTVSTCAAATSAAFSWQSANSTNARSDKNDFFILGN